VTESSVIADFLDERYPSPSLSPEGLEAAEAARAPVFGSFARYCKSADAEADAELKKALLLALCNLDAHLEKAAAPFAAGASLSRCDCFLLPALYHIRVAGAAFKGFEIPPQFTALNAYMDAMFESDLLYRTAPQPPMVKWGWANARGDAEAVERVSELRVGSRTTYSQGCCLRNHLIEIHTVLLGPIPPSILEIRVVPGDPGVNWLEPFFNISHFL
jgi:hypothetical protein